LWKLLEWQSGFTCVYVFTCESWNNANDLFELKDLEISKLSVPILIGQSKACTSNICIIKLSLDFFITVLVSEILYFNQNRRILNKLGSAATFVFAVTFTSNGPFDQSFSYILGVAPLSRHLIILLIENTNIF